MTKSSPIAPAKSPQARSIDEDALAVAKHIQSPGQTKEETKRIAKGIAKGIELYKRQENAKARERDKQRKRQLKTKTLMTEPTDIGVESENRPASSGIGSHIASVLGWMLLAFSCAALILLEIPLQLNGWAIPDVIVMSFGVLASALTLWQTSSLWRSTRH